MLNEHGQLLSGSHASAASTSKAASGSRDRRLPSAEKGRQSKNTIEIGSLQNQLKSDVGSEGNETTLKHASYREGRNNDNRRNQSDDSRGVEGNLKGEVGCVSLSADVYIHPTCQLSTQSWVRPRHMFRVLVLSDRVTYSQLSTALR